MEHFENISEFIATKKPEAPCFCLSLNEVHSNTCRLTSLFPGEIAYAVKSNPRREVLEQIITSGGQAWDVASISEIRLIDSLSKRLPAYYMNPIKSELDIKEAYSKYGIVDFAVDQEQEIQKFINLNITDKALTLFVRMAVAPEGAVVNMSGKFGVNVTEAARLINNIDKSGYKAGLTFHVGSQCLSTQPYEDCIGQAIQAVELSNVKIHSLDIGGGFPAKYEGTELGFDKYVEAIKRSIAGTTLENSNLRCEPGRAIAASSVSAVSKVIAVKHDTGLIHLNDGIYGGLSEINFLNCQFPILSFDRMGNSLPGLSKEWRLTGPTCDSSDMIKRTYQLPETIKPGDYVVFGMLGAYSPFITTQFNGFGIEDWVLVNTLEV